MMEMIRTNLVLFIITLHCSPGCALHFGVTSGVPESPTTDRITAGDAESRVFILTSRGERNLRAT